MTKMNDIFKNQSEVIDNIKESAKELGANIGDKTKRAPTPVAKKNCKMCWGKGWVTHSFPGNGGDDEARNFYCKCIKFK